MIEKTSEDEKINGINKKFIDTGIMSESDK